MSWSNNTAPAQPALVPVPQESLATAQQAVPMPWWWGRQKIAGRHLTPILSPFAIEAPNPPSPSKK